MAAVAFDTLRLAERLEAAGMPPQQARGAAAALAEAMSAAVATAADIATVRSEIRESELRLRGEIHDVEARLRGEIAAVRTEIANMRADLWKWVGGAVVVIIGAVAALVRLLH